MGGSAVKARKNIGPFTTSNDACEENWTFRELKSFVEKLEVETIIKLIAFPMKGEKMITLTIKFLLISLVKDFMKIC